MTEIQIQTKPFPSVMIDPATHAFIHYASITNGWIDFVVIVNSNVARQTAELVSEAMDQYWKSDDECYGDAVKRVLGDHGISPIIIFHDDTDESPEYEDAWEAFIKGFGTPYKELY